MFSLAHPVLKVPLSWKNQSVSYESCYHLELSFHVYLCAFKQEISL